MRVLLLGAGSMLARDLLASAPGGVDLMPCTRAEVDVTAESNVTAAVRQFQPDVVINCAGYTAVDEAEQHRDAAFAVNGIAPGVIGRAAREAGPGALVVHYGTDYVFDGRARHPYRENDPTDPLGVYGASKLAGERALRASGARYLIIRTQWLFGLSGRSFPRTMWERARRGQPTSVVHDQVGRPTYAVDLARATWGLVSDPPSGSQQPGEVLHVTNDGHATWYEVALHIFQGAGVPNLVTPCATRDYPTLAPRPAYSVLDTSRHRARTGSSLPRWEDAVHRFLQELNDG